MSDCEAAEIALTVLICGAWGYIIGTVIGSWLNYRRMKKGKG